MQVFDEMVDDLLSGEVLLAEFDSGLTISANADYVGITIEDDDTIMDIKIEGDELDYLHLFLEAIFVARQKIEDIDWDQLLTN